MYHTPIRRRHSSPKLRVAYASIEDAKRAFPACERTALRAFAKSEASRIANRVIRPTPLPESFSNVIAMFADADAISHAALRSKRFDFVLMLLSGGKFERRIARRLVRQGRLSAGVLA